MSEQSESFVSVGLQCLVYSAKLPETATVSVKEAVGVSPFNQIRIKMQKTGIWLLHMSSDS